MIGLNVAIIRADHIEEGLMNVRKNCISNGHRLKIEIRQLAQQC